MAESPFLNPDPERVFFQSELAIGLWDGFPVNPGHALIVPRRLVPTWFEATREEQIAILDGIEAAKQAIEELHTPQGYNIGINVGAAGGQTIFHLHVHVIPRYEGDVSDPRGGVRYVIPRKANYLIYAPKASPDRVQESYLAPTGQLIGQRLLDHLWTDLDGAAEIQFAVAFLLRSGWRRISDRLWDLLVQRRGRATILTGDYLDVTDPDALQSLLDLSQVPEVDGRLCPFVFGATQARTSFHPKAYLFLSKHGASATYVGSSNLSESALTSGVEWNYRLSQIPADVRSSFEGLLQHPATVPLTQEWLDQYRARRRAPATPKPVEVVTEAPSPPPQPHPVQQEALEALEKTRARGNGAGLVVLATGLGKTWLAAFDSLPFARVLFIAHREEILSQAHRTFRRIRPLANLGFFTGKAKDLKSEVLFASVQTLRNHYKVFSPSAFDYIVVDEFHHADAVSYRKILDHFLPRFLLGLTATPERTDGGDLLGLCGQNVVFRCELVQGIRRELLCPFQYYGVPDEVDYSNIPWRSQKFDQEALTAAVATLARAQNILEQFETRAGSRTIGFCCSRDHADFMADYFKSRGRKAAAVHSGPRSSHRQNSLEKLASGELEILFSVDMFNEGLDLPQVDTVMMLRPTESRILWLQQLGRGLRKAEGKESLVVIDYIGNHRTFLTKLQTLFVEVAACTRGSDAEIKWALDKLGAGELSLPAGCEITYDLRTVEILEKLLRTAKSEALELFLKDFQVQHDRRPTAAEAYHEGYNPRAVSKSFGSWFGFLETKGALTDEERRELGDNGQFFTHLETTPMVKSYKMVLLQAMLSRVNLPGGIGIEELAEAFVTKARRSARLTQDVSESLDDLPAIIRLLEKNPIGAWTGGKGTKGVAHFRYGDRVFESTTLRSEHPDVLSEIVRELVDWRLAEYLDRANDLEKGGFMVKVNHNKQGPCLLPLPRKKHPDIPLGEVPVLIEGDEYLVRFVSIAVNVAQKQGATTNDLAKILTRWFGEDAGASGTRHFVKFEMNRAGTWEMMKSE